MPPCLAPHHTRLSNTVKVTRTVLLPRNHKVLGPTLTGCFNLTNRTHISFLGKHGHQPPHPREWPTKLASTTTQSPCPRVLASKPELAKGQDRARFIFEGSGREATALRNFLSASVGSSDLRRPGQLRSQEAVQHKRLRAARCLSLPRCLGARKGASCAGSRSPTTGRLRSTSLPRGEAARGGARRAGPRPRQLLSKMDAMRPPRRRSIAASASSADLGRPGAWAQPARTVDGRGWLRQQALSSRTRHPQRPCPGTNVRRRGAEQAWPARLPLALRHPPWPGEGRARPTDYKAQRASGRLASPDYKSQRAPSLGFS